jgi:outer membrane protein, heavy metal efflux system
MRQVFKRTSLAVFLAFAPLLTGCADERAYQAPPSVESSLDASATKQIDMPKEPVKLASAPSREELSRPSIHDEGIRRASAEVAAKQSAIADVFHGDKTLTPARLVQIVAERSTTLDQMRATAEAVKARYPQVVSLEDPMLGFTTAPGSAWSNNASYAARAEVTQKIPFPGKRELRGTVVQAEASAAVRDVDDARLQLIESALNAYADYYLTEQALAVNADNLKILDDFRKNAETRYKNGQAPQQDLLQADVEIARQQERTVLLERARRVATARLNTLMHLPPDSPLPPPDKTTPGTETLEPEALRAMAIAARPDLKALADRLTAEEASLAVANSDYKPDVELLASYDSFWQGAGGRPLQWQVGARINLPVQLSRRSGAVAEAQAKVAERRAELSRLTDQVNLQVQEAYEMLRESEKVIQLYDKKILPAAEANIKEAQSSYVNGKIPFISLIDAQRSLIGLKDRYYEVLAEAVRRRAALERAVGDRVDAARK